MTARNNQINWDKGFWPDTAEHRQAAVQSLCDHLGNQLYSMYCLGMQNCLTASCQCKQNPVCHCSDEGQRKEKKTLGVTEGVPFLLFHSWLPTHSDPPLRGSSSTIIILLLHCPRQSCTLLLWLAWGNFSIFLYISYL